VANVNNTVSVNTAEILQGAGKLSFGGVDLGSFRDGVTMTVATEYSYTRSDYAIGEIDSEATTATCEVNTTLEQGTVRNWCVSLGGNTSSSSSSSSSIIWDFGPEMAQNPQILKFLAMSETDKTKYRRIEFFKAQRIGSTATSFKRGAEVLFPVTWKCFLNTDSKFFRVTDPVDAL
jgi:hypothetical protein